MLSPRAICGVFLILFGAMEFVLRQGATAKSVTPRASDRGTTLLILISFSLAILSLSVPIPGPSWSHALQWLGVVGCAAGTALRIWAMHTLGQYYTRTLLTTPGQTVVQRGPYRLVRHPGYLSSMITWVCAAIGAGGVISTVLVCLLLAIAYTYRISTEERMLVAALGVDYEAYRRRSWRLIPFVY